MLSKLGDQQGVVTVCGRALTIDSANVKALARRGQALLSLGELEKAKLDFEAAKAGGMDGLDKV